MSWSFYAKGDKAHVLERLGGDTSTADPETREPAFALIRAAANTVKGDKLGLQVEAYGSSYHYDDELCQTVHVDIKYHLIETESPSGV